MTNNDRDKAFVQKFATETHTYMDLERVESLQRHLERYAMTAWRDLSIAPINEEIIAAVKNYSNYKITILRQTELGDWRTQDGAPHERPVKWMPVPHYPED